MCPDGHIKSSCWLVRRPESVCWQFRTKLLFLLLLLFMTIGLSRGAWCILLPGSPLLLARALGTEVVLCILQCGKLSGTMAAIRCPAVVCILDRRKYTKTWSLSRQTAAAAWNV